VPKIVAVAESGTSEAVVGTTKLDTPLDKDVSAKPEAESSPLACAASSARMYNDGLAN